MLDASSPYLESIKLGFKEGKIEDLINKIEREEVFYNKPLNSLCSGSFLNYLHLLAYHGNYSTVIEYVKPCLDEPTDSCSDFLIELKLIYLYVKRRISLTYQDVENLMTEVIRIVSEIGSLNMTDNVNRLHFKSKIILLDTYFTLSKYEDGLALFHSIEEDFEEVKEDEWIFFYYHFVISLIFLLRGNFDQTKYYLEKLDQRKYNLFFESWKNYLWSSYNYYMMNFEDAFSTASHSLKQMLQFGHPTDTIFPKTVIGLSSFYLEDKMKTTIKFTEEEVNFAKGSNQELALGFYHFYLARKALADGDYIEFENQSLLSIERFTNNSKSHVVWIAFNAFNIALTYHTEHRPEYYLAILEEVTSEIEIPFAIYYTKVANALLLKQSRRSIHRGQSEKLLREILEDEDFQIEALKVIVLLNLCDLLQIELSLLGEPEILQELIQYISILNNYAFKIAEPNLIIGTLIMKAKLALVNGDYPLVMEHLETAREYAKSSSDFKLINDEEITIVNQIERWAEFGGTDLDLKDKIELAQFETFLRSSIDIAKKLDMRNLQTYIKRAQEFVADK